MIFIDENSTLFDNDIRVTIGAFYPGEKIVTEYSNECFLKVFVFTQGCDIKLSVVDGAKTYDKSVTCEKDDRKVVRDELKRALYGILSEITGKSLPWGTLTGIRPVKIFLSQVENGKNDEEIRDFARREYFMSDRKIRLATDVARNEFKVLSNINYEKGYSLYVGIPFCPTTCLYCSFTSYPISMWKNRVDEYLDALIKELSFLSEHLKGKKADSIYIGGGTPTTLLPYQLERLISYIKENFDISALKEFTVEAGRPDSIDEAKLRALLNQGIGRISINPQTMNQKTLDIIGRRHTAEETVKAFKLARSMGFDDINMDIIVGLPGEKREDVQYTLERIKELAPDNLTVHSLAIKRAANLNINRNEYLGYEINNSFELMDMTEEYARAMGMLPYYLYRQKNMAGSMENVGYSKVGREGIYNILIMEEKQSIYAAGANSQSKIVDYRSGRIDRIENVKNVAEYISRNDEMIERKRRYFDEYK